MKNNFWKWLTNIWTLIVLALYLIDFFSGNKYNASVGVISVIYISLLSLYVGSKEFDRWTRKYQSVAHGELFVILWSVIIVVMAISATFSEGRYHIPSEVLATYIAVLGVFAITQKSKHLKKSKRYKK